MKNVQQKFPWIALCSQSVTLAVGCQDNFKREPLIGNFSRAASRPLITQRALRAVKNHEALLPTY